MIKLKMFLKARATLLATLLGLFLLSTGTSLVLFSFLVGDSKVQSQNLEDARLKIGDDTPRTEACPINGKLFTKAERDIWEKRRPITAIIENHAEARPQSGLSYSDVIYEAVAEGGITRFLNVFYCEAPATNIEIAPVRSARVYFIDWAAGYGDFPIFLHVGGANDYGGFGDTVKEARALELLETLGWRVPGGNDFDTTYDSGFPVLWRNYDRLEHPVATEHTMMASIDEAYAQAQERGFDNTYEGDAWDENFKPWLFADDKPANKDLVGQVAFGFWDNNPDYNVTWKYDSASNSYLRETGGKSHIDLITGQQLTAKNIAIIFSKERDGVDRNKHVLYTTVGTGDALIFQNGQVIEGSWTKDARNKMIRFKDSKGKEISLVRGKIWIEALAIGNKVDY